MGYFKRSMRSFIRWCMDDSEKIQEDTSKAYYAKGLAINTMSASSGNVGDGANGLNFTVFSATGGKVVQLRTFNHHTDSSRTSLYVITEKDDLGEELGMIITRESLSQ